MAAINDILIPSLTLEEIASDGSTLTNPAADHRRVFLGEDGALHLRDSAGGVTDIGSGGLADQGAFTYLDATEAAAPGTPASGSVRVYAKADGRIYSKDDTGAEYGPFDAAGGGGVAPSAFRLPSVKDDPADIALGTYGDEFEYATMVAFQAVWAKTNGVSGTFADADIIHGASDIQFNPRMMNGRGFVRTGLTIPADFEIGLLVSHPVGSMFAIGVHNGTIGVAAAQQGTTSYRISLGSNYEYTASGSGAGSVNQSGPVWYALRRLSGNWRVRFSNDGGASWTTSAAADAVTVSGADRIWIGSAYVDAQIEPRIHRVVYGAPNLGLG